MLSLENFTVIGFIDLFEHIRGFRNDLNNFNSFESNIGRQKMLRIFCSHINTYLKSLNNNYSIKKKLFVYKSGKGFICYIQNNFGIFVCDVLHCTAPISKIDFN